MHIFAQLYRRTKNLPCASTNWIYSHYHSTLYKWTVIEDNVYTSAACLTRTHQTHKFTYWCCHSKQCICLIIEQTARWIPCFPLANYSAPNIRCTYHITYQNQCSDGSGHQAYLKCGIQINAKHYISLLVPYSVYWWSFCLTYPKQGRVSRW